MSFQAQSPSPVRFSPPRPASGKNPAQPPPWVPALVSTAPPARSNRFFPNAGINLRQKCTAAMHDYFLTNMILFALLTPRSRML